MSNITEGGERGGVRKLTDLETQDGRVLGLPPSGPARWSVSFSCPQQNHIGNRQTPQLQQQQQPQTIEQFDARQEFGFFLLPNSYIKILEKKSQDNRENNEEKNKNDDHLYTAKLRITNEM